ncbi:MAG TPA: hypothetical protein VEL31_22615 [Ktedonobacteraceae bacterium]|nr:hypothetical protein [Ktedonobacteraceae bacterium]
MEPYLGRNGKPTQLLNVSYGALPIDTAFVGKASQNTVSMPEHGMAWSYSGKNATQGHFALQAG